MQVGGRAVRMHRKRLGVGSFVCAALIFLSAAANASAESITYTEQTIGSGTLDGMDFANVLITIALSGDTTTVLNEGGGLFYDFGSATVMVAGVGSASLTGPAQANVFSNNPVGAAGIGDSGSDILDIYNSAFNSYSLVTAIGPITGPPNYIPGESFAVTNGDFVLTGARTSTFTAITNSDPPATPEPPIANVLIPVLLVLGLAGLRRKQFV